MRNRAAWVKIQGEFESKQQQKSKYREETDERNKLNQLKLFILKRMFQKYPLA
jgi:hypothetical protein